MPEAAPARRDAPAAGGEEGDDDALVAAAVRGDRRALEELIGRHRPKVFRIASRYSRSSHETEEIAQDVFVKMYFNLATYRADAPFEHWLSRIAVRTCYDHLRARQRNREAALSHLTDDQSAWLDRAQAANSQEQSAALESAEAARELAHRALEKLAPAERTVLTLLEIEGKSVAEIASLTGWSKSNVKVRAFRARKVLRKVVERLMSEKQL